MPLVLSCAREAKSRFTTPRCQKSICTGGHFLSLCANRFSQMPHTLWLPDPPIHQQACERSRWPLKSGNYAPTITSLCSVSEPHLRRFDRSAKPATSFSSSETGKPRSYTKGRCREASAFRVLSPVVAMTSSIAERLCTAVSVSRAAPRRPICAARESQSRPKLSVVSLSRDARVNGCCFPAIAWLATAKCSSFLTKQTDRT